MSASPHPYTTQSALTVRAMRVRDVITAYLRHSRSEGVHCACALSDRERTLGLFAQLHGDCPCESMRAFHLRDFIADHPTWKSSATRRQKANQVRACFNWAVNEERIDRNPFRNVHYAEADRRPDMADTDFERICAVASKPFERALRFLRLTGCRISEMCRAQWGDMDLARGAWVIPKHKGRRYSHKPKVIALVPAAVALLASVTADRGPVFCNHYGRPWRKNTLVQHLDRLKKRHGIDTAATLHGIRHRFGSAAVAAGAPLKLVSAQLGHASQATTERYYVCLDGELEAVKRAAVLASVTLPESMAHTG